MKLIGRSSLPCYFLSVDAKKIFYFHVQVKKSGEKKAADAGKGKGKGLASSRGGSGRGRGKGKK